MGDVPKDAPRRGIRVDLLMVRSGLGFSSACSALVHSLESRGEFLNLHLSCRILDAEADIFDAFADDAALRERSRLLAGSPFATWFNSRVSSAPSRASACADLEHALHALEHGAMRGGYQRALEAFWTQRGAPDVCVSVVPAGNAIVREALKAVAKDARMITCAVEEIVQRERDGTHSWVDAEAGAKEQNWICCSEKSAEVAVKKLGLPAQKVRQVSGRIIHGDFYGGEKRPALQTKPNVLVCFGGYPSEARTMEAVRALKMKFDGKVSVTVVCGRNMELELKLKREPKWDDLKIIGLTQRMHELMKYHDIFIGKPGPALVNEAIQSGTICLLHSKDILAQEMPVMEMVSKNGYGMLTDVSDPQVLEKDLRAVIADHATMRGRIQSNYENSAVMEATDYILGLAVSKPGKLQNHNSAPGKSRL